jgi:tellurite resistance protein|tara:strand:- start:582 stop:1019 length:438 start_codon:yes stop_codon:yes gene_type:complete
MGWFSNKDNDSPIGNKPSEMSPLEAVTHLCAAIQLADGQLDHQERQEWLVAVTELFPEFSEDRADNFLMEAQTTINQLNNSERGHHLKEVLDRINSLLTDDQISTLSSKIANLIEADGIIMTSEIEIASMIEKELGITISLDENL